MEILRPQVSQIRSALETNPHIKLVGDLQVVDIGGYSRVGARRDFYVEPLDPPIFGELTDLQVDALDAAAYYKRQPTRELTTIPRRFSAVYNQILLDILPADQFPGEIRPFGFVSNLAASRVQLGYRRLEASDNAGSVYTRIETQYEDPVLQAQAEKVGSLPVQEITTQMSFEVRVRLFTPGMGELVYQYEKGFYQDGNVVEWDQSKHNNLVYKGRYISMDQLSPDQLQAIARGEFPFPRIEYLERSEFEGNSEEVQKLLRDRLSFRSVDIDFMFGPGGIARGTNENETGDFDENSYDQGELRRGDPSAIHTH